MHINSSSSMSENPEDAFMGARLSNYVEVLRQINYPFINQKRTPGKKIPINAHMPIINWQDAELFAILGRVR